MQSGLAYISLTQTLVLILSSPDMYGVCAWSCVHIDICIYGHVCEGACLHACVEIIKVLRNHPYIF